MAPPPPCPIELQAISGVEQRLRVSVLLDGGARSGERDVVQIDLAVTVLVEPGSRSPGMPVASDGTQVVPPTALAMT